MAVKMLGGWTGTIPLMVPLMALTLTGCDSGSLDLAREFQLARGDCTLDALRDSAEECVQMFERFTDLGVDLANTYIGALNAMEMAIQRNSPGAIRSWDLPGSGDYGAAFDDDPTGRYWNRMGDPEPGTIPGHWDGTPPWMPSGEFTPDSPHSSSDTYSAEPVMDGHRIQRFPQRGVLLPPEERLQRPWLTREYDQGIAYDRQFDDPTIRHGGSSSREQNIRGSADLAPGYDFYGAPRYNPGYGGRMPGYGPPIPGGNLGPGVSSSGGNAPSSWRRNRRHPPAGDHRMNGRIPETWEYMR